MQEFVHYGSSCRNESGEAQIATIVDDIGTQFELQETKRLS
jgi:hypothetical protein